MIPMTVVGYDKDHGLFGIDVFKLDATKLINSIKGEETNIGF